VQVVSRFRRWFEWVVPWVAVAIPWFAASQRVGADPMWRDDMPVVRGLGLAAVGGASTLTTVAMQAASLVPLGPLPFRLALVSSVALSICAGLVFLLSRRILETHVPGSFLNTPLAGVAALDKMVSMLPPEEQALVPGYGAGNQPPQAGPLVNVPVERDPKEGVLVNTPPNVDTTLPGYTPENPKYADGPLITPNDGPKGPTLVFNENTGAPMISGVTVVDQRTGTVYQGTVDLQPTLDRIASGGAPLSRNDGTVFQNRPVNGEQLLPVQPAGYYTEYVVPTPGINGPGPQRIITGKGGEIYYTPDHYQSFIPVKK